MRIIVLGLSLSSSWGNGHATTYRALLKGLAARGHDILFLERAKPWYEAHQDLTEPDYCELEVYRSLEELERYRSALQAADAVIVGSFVPQGKDVIRLVRGAAGGLFCFYDIDTPATLSAIEQGSCQYLDRSLIPVFDAYFSFTGGPILQRLEREFGAARALPLYCSVDTDLYRPSEPSEAVYDLGYLGTFSPDRQPWLERLMFDAARRAPCFRFIVAGAQYPASIDWPQNVQHVDHVPPDRHADFYGSLRWALNLTRRDMRSAGYSPSVRLFEAGACGTPVLTDSWPGLNDLFQPGSEIRLASSADSILIALSSAEARRLEIAGAYRDRVLRSHSGFVRAEELERALHQLASGSGKREFRHLRRGQSEEPPHSGYVPGHGLGA